MSERPLSLTKSQNAILELLETESVFKSDMEGILKGYYTFFESFEDGHIFNQIKSSILQLCEFSKTLYQSFCRSQDSIEELARVFIDKSEQFIAVYGNYCEIFPLTTAILESVDPMSEKATLLDQCKKKIKQMLPLSSYLLKPVQRILKYHLLIRTIESDKTIDEQCRESISVASEMMKNVADTINEKKRMQDGVSRLPSLRKQLTNLTTPLNFELCGPVILEDDIKVNRKHRKVILFEYMLLIADILDGKQLSVVRVIPTDSVVLIENTGNALSIELRSENHKKKQLLKFSKKSDKDSWVLHIKRLILKNSGVKLGKIKLIAMFGEQEAKKLLAITDAHNLKFIDDVISSIEPTEQESQDASLQHSLPKDGESKIYFRKGKFNLESELNKLRRPKSARLETKPLVPRVKNGLCIDGHSSMALIEIVNSSGNENTDCIPLSSTAINQVTGKVNQVLDESETESLSYVKSVAASDSSTDHKWEKQEKRNSLTKSDITPRERTDANPRMVKPLIGKLIHFFESASFSEPRKIERVNHGSEKSMEKMISEAELDSSSREDTTAITKSQDVHLSIYKDEDKNDSPPDLPPRINNLSFSHSINKKGLTMSAPIDKDSETKKTKAGTQEAFAADPNLIRTAGRIGKILLQLQASYAESQRRFKKEPNSKSRDSLR